MTFDPTLAFHAKNTLAHGLTRRGLASPRYRRLLPGVYVATTHAGDPLTAARAALAGAVAEAFVSHHTAARLYGGIVPDDPALHASVRGKRHRSRKDGLVVHRSTRTPSRLRGVPVTSPTDTFCDLAAHLTLLDLVVLGDSLVKRQQTTPEALVAAAASWPDCPSPTSTSLSATNTASPCAASILATAARIGIEYDGRQHAESSKQWQGDITRREGFDALGWRLPVVGAEGIHKNPADTLDRLVAIMRQRGLPVPVLRDDWRAHFPGHG